MNEMKIDWEGYPGGVEEWMKKQKASVAILMVPGGGEFI